MDRMGNSTPLMLERLSNDLTARFGRGFSRINLGRFRQFYIAHPVDQIRATLSLKSPEDQEQATMPLEAGQPAMRPTRSARLSAPSIRSTLSNEFNLAGNLPTGPVGSPGPLRQAPSGQSAQPPGLADLARAFPLPWSHYVLLMGRSRSPEAFAFYPAEALRGGWASSCAPGRVRRWSATPPIRCPTNRSSANT